MKLRNLLIMAGLAICIVSFGFGISEAAAAQNQEEGATVTLSSSPQEIENTTCLYCHAQKDLSVELDSGETLALTIDPDAFEHSTHGSNAMACVTCHTTITKFPHQERPTPSIRDVKLKYYTSCQECHSEQFELTLDSVHQRALAQGNKNAAVCADCHNPHTQQKLTDENGHLLDSARLHVPETCAQCHSAIYDAYEESVHGKALTEEGNKDVPTCIDCHGVHNIQSATVTSFHNSTPFLCAKCHTDKTLMSKYDLSTQVLDTYVADFHGTTVEVFNKSFPDQPTNKPVCTDCHGIHDIVKTDDPARGVSIKENLLVRCQACHPDANANFPDTWLSHYIPSPEKYPIVYYINLLYKYLIPGVLIPMGLLVVMDFWRALINRFRKPKKNKSRGAKLPSTESEPQDETPPAPQEQESTTNKEASDD